VLQGSLEAGAATLKQPTQPTVTAPTLAGELRADGSRAALRAAGGAALGGTSRWSAQGDVAASWLSSASARAAWELGAAASALRYNGTPAAASGAVLVRRHSALGVVPGGGGVWAGVGAGLLGRQRGRTAPSGSAEAGGWLRHDRLRASLTLAVLRTRLDTTIVELDGNGGEIVLGHGPARAIVAVDATAAAEWRAPSLELTASAALRRAPRQAEGVLGSVYAVGAWWILPRAALTASAGTLAADPLRGFPQRRLTALGIRMRLGGAPASGAPASSAARATHDAPAADVVARGAGRVLRVRAPGAARVEVRGDFTGWQPAELARASDASGAWELALAAAASAVRLTIRVDGGPWRAPANLPSVEDEFGGRSGLLVIP
jgi:hypothetical protein